MLDAAKTTPSSPRSRGASSSSTGDRWGSLSWSSPRLSKRSRSCCRDGAAPSFWTRWETRQAASLREIYRPRLSSRLFRCGETAGLRSAWSDECVRPYVSLAGADFSRARAPAPHEHIMFIDEAKIRVKAGDGGNGCMACRREKHGSRGGPSGGDGGHGGDIWMESSERHNTLVHFRFNPEYKAERGRHGEGAKKTGRDGGGIVLKGPVGTIVYDEDTSEEVHDFSDPHERVG